MTQNNLITDVVNSGNIWKPVLWGAAIGLVLMALFLMGVEGDPAWGEYWKLRPMMVTPIAGAMGGGFFHFMDYIGREGGWKRIFCSFIGILGFIIALWLGSVLGLDGTLWN